MNRIDQIFAERRAANRPALMPFLCGGYPTLAATRAALGAVQSAGAAIAEIGFPFSDPVADGPVISAAMHEALAAGITPAQILQAVAEARRDGASLGLVAMVSVSIVHRIGAQRFAKDAATAGIDGFIVPDAPVEESGELAKTMRDSGLTLSLLVAPTTSPARAERIVRSCSGFVYLLARTGITGDAPATFAPGIDVAAVGERVRLLRSMTALPIACGFGISTADHVRQIVGAPQAGGAGADAAIVGSALVKRMSRAASQGRSPVEEAELFVRGLAMGL